jgi:2'-hydroxyisoflavone reductase
MKILILGGTVFLGRAIVDAALAKGHTVTLFNRGQSNPDLFPDTEKITGDRKVSLEALRGRNWETVIDTCGYVPRLVRGSAEFLAGAISHYTFISTCSVYADTSQPGVDENGAVGRLVDDTEEVNGETYGPLKALCEQAVDEVFSGQALVLRPGLIVGPNDPTDRFTYWPHRVAGGGEVLAPGRPGRAVQFIDVRDLAEWTIRMVEAGQTGVYNALGPATPLDMKHLLESCKTVAGSNARFTWIDDQFLKDQQVGEWIEIPLWIAESEPANRGFFAFNIEKALAAGLTFRPLAETIRATLEWDATREKSRVWRAGLTPQREEELLRLWKDKIGKQVSSN